MADTSEFVIQYLADISNVKKKIKEIERVNKTAGANLGKDFGKAIDVVDRRIKSIQNKPVFDKNLGKTVIKTFAKVETVFKGTDGKLKTLTQSTVLANGKLKTLNSTVRNGANVARTFGQNMATLTKRALVTIPVWFALRTAIFGVFRTIRDGLKDIVEFDKALQKLRRNIEATSSTVDTDFNKARGVIEEFSLKSGKSVQQVTNAIQKFATVGFDFETSLEGGLRATQLAVTLFGDAEETANAFARSLRVLTEDISDPIQQQKEIAQALALTDQLWQTNAFEVSEFSNNLEKFAGTAKIANLSIEDTLTLLATLSTAGLGNRAGRLLRSTILKSLADVENITKVLDLDFDPNSQSTIVFLSELISKLKELRVTNNVPVELAETLADLFSVRSTEALAGLTALEDTLKSNLALTPDVEKFDATFEKLLGTTGSLAEQFTNVKSALGRVFVEGLVGGDDFEDSLQRIVDFLRESTDGAKQFGVALRGAGSALAGIASGLEIIVSFASLGALPLVKEMVSLSNETKKVQDALDKATDSSQDFGIQLNKALDGDLVGSGLERVIAGIEARLKFDNVDPGFDRIVLEKSLDVLKERIEIEKQISTEKEKQSKTTEKTNIANNKRKELAELVLKNELAILKISGARASQIIQAEQFLRSQLDIEKTKLQQLEDQLNKEREINNERRLRSEIGNDSIKLFRIAEQEGTDVAKTIGDVLTGNIDFGSFVKRGGKELDIFKQQFGDVFEQQQALSFFKGDTVAGAPGLRGGSQIAIEEEALRTSPRRFNAGAQLEQRSLERAISDLNIQKQTVQAGVVNLSTPTAVNTGQNLQTPNPNLSISSQQRAGVGNRVVDLNLNIDGRNFSFSGTPEAGAIVAKNIALQVTNDPQFRLAIESQIVQALGNPQSKTSRAVDEKLNNF